MHSAGALVSGHFILGLSFQYCAAGILYMVQNFFTILSILEGEIPSRRDEKRSKTEENDLSLVAAP